MNSGAIGREEPTGTLVACDLDRTLVWSLRAVREVGGGEDELVCVERRDGREVSYVTARAAALLAEAVASGGLLPITSRSVEQYRRIDLPRGVPAYAVCLNGGRLLVDGVVDEDYTAAVARHLGDVAAYDEVHALLAGWNPPGFARLHGAEATFAYLVLAAPLASRTELDHRLEQLHDLLAPTGWVVHENERKLYCLPARLTKTLPFDLRPDLLAGRRLWATGDSTMDVDLLALAEQAMVPRSSILDRAGWTRPHVSTTRACGVLAGEEIAGWVHHAVCAWDDDGWPPRPRGGRPRPGCR